MFSPLPYTPGEFTMERPKITVPQKAIDSILTTGSNEPNSLARIIVHCSRAFPLESTVQFMKQEYGADTGRGIVVDGIQYSAWFTDDGIQMAQGMSGKTGSYQTLVTWDAVASRTLELLEAGQFATALELVEAQSTVRSGCANALFLTMRELQDGQPYCTKILDYYRQKKGFPQCQQELADHMATPEGLAEIAQEYEEFLEAYHQDPTILRFHVYESNQHQIDTLLAKIDLPPREFPINHDFRNHPQLFITQDEIDQELCKGGIGQQMDIYRLFTGNLTPKELQDKLKLEGGYNTFHGSGHTGFHMEKNPKGITLRRDYNGETYGTVNLSLPQIVKRYKQLIEAKVFPSPAALEQSQAPETTPMWQAYLTHKEENPDHVVLFQLGDFYEVFQEDAQQIAKALDFQVGKRTIKGVGEIPMCGIPVHRLEECVETLLDKGISLAMVPTENRETEALLLEGRTAPLTSEIEKEPMPEILFFQDFKDIESDLDYTQYEDGDILGYNADGVRYNVGKSGNLVYTTQTAAITPYGQVLGDDMPPEIREKFIVWKQSLVVAEPVPEIPAQNFHITDMALGNGAPKEKFKRNIRAIETLQTLEKEQRNATPGEQELLSQYVGWGGLADAFDPNKSNWASEYTQLKDLLTDSEYSDARASTLNAHYTSPAIIEGMYDALAQMGFISGNVLEPACGTGHFFGMLPQSMDKSNLFGVELDGITARIAQKLYPNANITQSGFEKADFPDNFFDVAIGNVPFGNYKLVEKRYDGHGFLIHDHFLARSLDKVRPGGVVAFITSKGTLDKENPKVRKYLAERADLIGVIRLPNNAFKANAGTEVTSDIIFLQKRESPVVVEPDWVHLGLDENNIPINSYFIDHPEMVLGTMAMQSGPFGQESTCVPTEGAILEEQLKIAVSHLQATIPEAELSNLDAIPADTIPADPNVKNYSYTIVNDQVYYRENAVMAKVQKNATALERIKGLVQIRDCVSNLMQSQLDDAPDQTIADYQTQLNDLYDTFTEKYGLVTGRANGQAMAGDSSYFLLCSLEDVNEDGTLKAKADMFTKRTIKQATEVTKVDTPSEALAVSIAQKAKVDLPFMAQLTGMDVGQITKQLEGVIFPVPYSGEDAYTYVTADEYLSGNVRHKLRVAKQATNSSPEFAPNVEALTLAQPKDLDASEIDVRLGATWVNTDYIQDFMYELLETPRWQRGSNGIQVHYSPISGEWRITNKNSAGFKDVPSRVTYGTDRMNAYYILENTLNLRDARVYDTVTDPDGKERRVLNKDATTAVGQKQQMIKDKFKDWIFRDADRRQALVTLYNEKFNNLRPREYDGRHITFGGINPVITLREHQVNAIAHILYGKNVLLAHEVGAGKTFAMVAGAMESKRLGLCHKSLFAVPNHLIEQWAGDFLRLYPGANILVATSKDFEKANRKKFCARIATGDYDAIIMGHSQFERIPMSLERQEQLIQDQIDEIEEGIREAKYNNSERFTIKQFERTKRGLENRMEKLRATHRKDDVVTFEQLGVDRLYVDEAHSFKNLFLFTKMQNVSGLSTSDAQKSSDMFSKCRYLDEITGGTGIVFATGTPVSNSMTELYTMQRYLQYDTLVESGLIHFDSWASTFGETTTSVELTPDGVRYEGGLKLVFQKAG